MERIEFNGGSASIAVSGTLSRSRSTFGADVRLPAEKVKMILHCLVEGNSVRATSRLCDVEKRTVLNMLTLAGEVCERLFAERVRNVPVKDLELDEVWTYVGCHQKRLTPERVAKGMVGDAYTFIGLERTSKLVVAWHLGKRDRINTEDFVSKIRTATAPGRFDVSTDAFQPYESAIDAGLYDRANHSQVVKLFSNRLDRVSEGYSPARFVAVAKDVVSGESRSKPRWHVSYRTKERDTPHVVQASLQADALLLEEMGQSESGAGLALCALQFLPRAWLAANHASDGSRGYGPHLDN